MQTILSFWIRFWGKYLARTVRIVGQLKVLDGRHGHAAGKVQLVLLGFYSNKNVNPWFR